MPAAVTQGNEGSQAVGRQPEEGARREQLFVAAKAQQCHAMGDLQQAPLRQALAFAETQSGGVMSMKFDGVMHGQTLI